MNTYRTQSGSIYDVDGDMVRRRVQSSTSGAKRVSPQWRRADVKFQGIGLPLAFTWGLGKDEHSATAAVIGEGPDETRIRMTVTSPVVGVNEPEHLPQ